MAGSVEDGGRITQFFNRSRDSLFKINSTGFVSGKSKVMILFNVWQPCEKLLKKRSPIIEWERTVPLCVPISWALLIPEGDESTMLANSYSDKLYVVNLVGFLDYSETSIGTSSVSSY